jgi:protein-disulfide isomerase
VDVSTAAITGPAGAKVTIVEFSDFQCPYCGRGYEVMQELKAAYGDKVRFAFMNFPLPQIHQHAEKTAEAFECARDQDNGKAWKLHDLLFQTQADWSKSL